MKLFRGAGMALVFVGLVGHTASGLTLREAVVEGSPKDVARLLKAGVDPTKTYELGWTLLHILARGEAEAWPNKIAKAILDSIKDKDARKRFLDKQDRLTAISNGDTAISLVVQKYIELRLDEGEGWGEGSLFPDVISRFEKHKRLKPLLETFLKNGADPNIADAFGTAPLHRAAAESTTMTKTLIGNKTTNVNVLDKDSRTPLHWAARAGNIRTVNVLLKHKGIEVNAIDGDGNTPLDDVQEVYYVGGFPFASDPDVADKIRNKKGKSGADIPEGQAIRYKAHMAYKEELKAKKAAWRMSDIRGDLIRRRPKLRKPENRQKLEDLARRRYAEEA